MNQDNLNSVHRSAVAEKTLAIMDLYDRRAWRKGEALAALACATYLSAQQFGVSPERLWEIGRRLTTDADRKQVPEFRAAARYIRNEIQSP